MVEVLRKIGTGGFPNVNLVTTGASKTSAASMRMLQPSQLHSFVAEMKMVWMVLHPRRVLNQPHALERPARGAMRHDDAQRAAGNPGHE